MTKRVNLAWLTLALMAAGAAAQTTVTTSGTTSSGTVPVFNGTATVTNSPISISGGNVGIGTASPSTALDVNGGVSVEGNTLYLRSPGDSYHHIRYGTVGGISDADGIIFSSSFTLAHGPDGSETPRFVVQGAGNVGIGTTSPGAPLEVNGAAKVDNGLFVGNSSGDNAYTTPAPAGIVLGGGNQSGLSTYSSIGNGSTYGVLNYYGNISENYMRYFDIAAVASLGGMASRIRFLTQGYIVSGPVERMRITEGGNVGIGTTAPQYPLDVAGQIHTSGGIVFPNGDIQTIAYTGTCSGGDYAESVDVAGNRKQYEPGDVLVLDADNPGKMLKSIEAYSTSVSGIYSTKPGTLGRRQTTAKSPDEVPMAVVGIVPAKVSAENGPIKVGDLLVSSSTPGYAMKGTDRGRMLGAVVGKAMAKLDSGTGVIEVLVTLQ
jgi:hypothetical protein